MLFAARSILRTLFSNTGRVLSHTCEILCRKCSTILVRLSEKIIDQLIRLKSNGQNRRVPLILRKNRSDSAVPCPSFTGTLASASYWADQYVPYSDSSQNHRKCISLVSLKAIEGYQWKDEDRKKLCHVQHFCYVVLTGRGRRERFSFFLIKLYDLIHNVT
jgi:hypothetical protein